MILRCDQCGHQGRWKPDDEMPGLDLQMVQHAQGQFAVVPIPETARCNRCGHQWVLTPAEVDEGNAHELAVVLHMTRFALGMRPYGRHEVAS